MAAHAFLRTGAFPTSARHWAIPNNWRRFFPVWRDPMSSKANSRRVGFRYSHPTPSPTTGITASGASRSLLLAMRRLEVRGKGILLLHDIHPATVAATPGLLKALKNKGFHNHLVRDEGVAGSNPATPTSFLLIWGSGVRISDRKS